MVYLSIFKVFSYFSNVVQWFQLSPIHKSGHKIITEMLDKISNWILTLDLSSNNITGIQDTLKTSIFINGNLARVLISNYKISGKDIYLNEALKWCDTFVSLQHDITTSINTIGGYWDTGYSEGTSCVPLFSLLYICIYLSTTPIIKHSFPNKIIYIYIYIISS